SAPFSRAEMAAHRPALPPPTTITLLPTAHPSVRLRASVYKCTQFCQAARIHFSKPSSTVAVVTVRHGDRREKPCRRWPARPPRRRVAEPWTVVDASGSTRGGPLSVSLSGPSLFGQPPPQVLPLPQHASLVAPLEVFCQARDLVGVHRHDVAEVPGSFLRADAARQADGEKHRLRHGRSHGDQAVVAQDHRPAV